MVVNLCKSFTQSSLSGMYNYLLHLNRISDNELDSHYASVDSFDLPATPRSYSNGFRVQITFQSQYKSSNHADYIQPTEVFFLRIFLKYGMINDVVIHQYQYNPVS
jgi:hypothetical protein